MYDNFWFQGEYVKEYTGKWGDRFDEIMFGNDDDKVEVAVSNQQADMG